jgi:hypothetical protein
VLLARHRQTGISSVIAGLGFFLLGQINPCLLISSNRILLVSSVVLFAASKHSPARSFLMILEFRHRSSPYATDINMVVAKAVQFR